MDWSKIPVAVLLLVKKCLKLTPIAMRLCPNAIKCLTLHCQMRACRQWHPRGSIVEE